MSLSHSPSIVTNGLVFYYDMGNSQKSWKGAPTTNLITNKSLVIHTGSSSATINNSYSLTAPDGSTGWSSITATSTNANHRIAQFPYINLTSGVTYSFSIELFNPSPDGLSVGIDGTAGTGFSNIPSGYSKWTYTTTPSAAWSENIFFATQNQVSTVTYSPARTIYFKNPQIEVGSFATPYVDGTRSNTQALIDLTGSNTITATSLTYASDGTFSWSSGVDARLQSPASSNFAFGTGDFTLECWIKPVNFSGYTHMIALPDQSIFALKANNADGAIYFYNPTFTTYGSTTGWTLVANVWNHVIMTRSSGIAYCYLNGSLIGSKSGFTNSFSSQVLNIGNGYSGEYTAKSISSVKIYNRALTAAEVKQNFDALRGRYGL